MCTTSLYDIDYCLKLVEEYTGVSIDKLDWKPYSKIFNIDTNKTIDFLTQKTVFIGIVKFNTNNIDSTIEINNSFNTEGLHATFHKNEAINKYEDLGLNTTDFIIVTPYPLTKCELKLDGIVIHYNQ